MLRKGTGHRTLRARRCCNVLVGFLAGGFLSLSLLVVPRQAEATCLQCSVEAPRKRSCTDSPARCDATFQNAWQRCTPKGTAVQVPKKAGRCYWENPGCELSGDCPSGGSDDKTARRVTKWDGGGGWFCAAEHAAWECWG